MRDLIPLRVYLQVEGAIALAAAVSFYWQVSFSWWFFAVLFFAPDVSMLGYVVGLRVGALIYNVAHTYTTPALVLLIGCLMHSPTTIAIGLIWVGHIGFDRMFGFGLKHDSGFRQTHFDQLG